MNKSREIRTSAVVRQIAKGRQIKEQLSDDSREWLIHMMAGNRARDVYFVTAEGLAA